MTLPSVFIDANYFRLRNVDKMANSENLIYSGHEC